MFVLCAAMLFGGAGGTWFAASAGSSWLIHGLQLAAGSIVMGALAATAGSLLFGRNPVRWGAGVPFMIYLGGMLVALVTGREGGLGLFYGAPLFLGMAIAAGVFATFLIDGLFLRPVQA